ncbi:dynamin family protein [Georgenia faecalis]|uniref:dynamin family protein n=1 Tax=Georgenia faecalis TaxID=2483799 RepID=UPI000FDCBD61|nr:dynamin family protein [Georgenia faecalis]
MSTAPADGAAGQPGAPEAVSALRALSALLADVRLPLEVPGVPASRALRSGVVDQLDDYVIPRFASLEAPLLAVVGGSTGAGKSTLVNSLVRAEVSYASAIRPTTRRPVLVHHPADAAWFEDGRILPHLARVRAADRPAAPGGTGEAMHAELELRAVDSVPPGLALLDAPDIDSVVSENRALAAQLLAAADLWLFVTTAARYADAVPWALLREAAARRVVVGIVLDRVPPGDAADVRADLAAHLVTENLAHAPLFVVSETARDTRGMLPEADVAHVRSWLQGLAADAHTRAAVARQTLLGAVGAALARAQEVAGAAGEQVAEATALADAVHDAYTAAVERVMDTTADGTLLRGEVLARWQEFVGTGEWFRSLEASIGRLRDRITDAFRGRPAPQTRVAEAVESGLVTLIVAEAERAALDARRAWQADPAGRALLDAPEAALGDPAGARAGLAERVEVEVRAWQQGILDRVRTEGEDRRTRARMLSLGVNVSGVSLMLVVFALSGGITGAEFGVAGGTAVVGQKVLEMVFGDQAVREMAAAASEDLRRRTGRLFAEEAYAHTGRLDALGIDREAPVAVAAAIDRVRAGLHAAGMSR